MGPGRADVQVAVATDEVVVDAGTGTLVPRQSAETEVLNFDAENRTREHPVVAARHCALVLDYRQRPS